MSTITNHLIGKQGPLAPWKAKIGPNASGLRADLKDEYDCIVSVLNEVQVAVKKSNRKRKFDKKALNFGATVSSNAAYAEMAANTSPTTQRGKAKHINSVRGSGRGMDTFVRWEHDTVVSEHSHRIAHDQARLFLGCNLLDVSTDSPLFH